MTDTTIASKSPNFDAMRRSLGTGTGWTDERQKKAFVHFLHTAGGSTSEMTHELLAAKESALNPDSQERSDDGLYELVRDIFQECVQEGAMRCLSDWVQFGIPAGSPIRDLTFQRARIIIATFKGSKIFIDFCIRYLLENTTDSSILKAYEYAQLLAAMRPGISGRLTAKERSAFVLRMMKSPHYEHLMPAFKEYAAIGGLRN